MLLAQSVPVTDTPGWGLAEWATVTLLSIAVLGAVVSAIVQLSSIRRTTKKITDEQAAMRKENTAQHAEGRALTTDVRDRLLDLHTAVDRVDTRVERIDQRLDDHIEWHNEPLPTNLNRNEP